MAGNGCSGEESSEQEAAARVSGEAWGWETLDEEGKAGWGRSSCFLEHARGSETKGRRDGEGDCFCL
jgi:hypothetical protein